MTAQDAWRRIKPVRPHGGPELMCHGEHPQHARKARAANQGQPEPRAAVLSPSSRLAPPARLELATYGLEVRCSIQLSYEGSDGQHCPGRATALPRTQVRRATSPQTQLRIRSLWCPHGRSCPLDGRHHRGMGSMPQARQSLRLPRRCGSRRVSCARRRQR
jgi:hypothetical protein